MASVGTISFPTKCLVPAHTSSEPTCKLLRTPRHSHSSFAGLSSCKRPPGIDATAVAARPINRIEILNLSVVTDNEAESAFDQSQNELPLSVHAVAPVMKRGYGAFGGGATLEKSKLDLSQRTSQVAPKTEDGGGGGDIGKGINHGGGDGGDDGGDDDDYFGDADDDDEADDGGFFARRLALPEVFDRKIIEAIMQEWYKSVTDLPAGLRQAVELGFISSAQMVKYLSHIGRPTMARLISRAMPPSASRAFVGRMIADPSFLYKMWWEQAVTIAYGSWWEFKHRGERLKDEWGLAAMNILSMSLCNAAIVWSLAPCRSYGSTFKFNLQNTIQKLPNNVFERSYAFREFDMTKRVQSFFYKAGELCLVGLLTGAASGGLVKLIGSGKENVSVPAPTVRTSALSYGAYLGLSGNLRYQLVYGAERVMQQQFNHVGVVVFCSAVLRALNVYLGDTSRVSWLGLDAAADQNSERVQQAYRRPSLPSFNQLEGMLKFDNMLPKAPTRRKVKRRVLAAS